MPVYEGIGRESKDDESNNNDTWSVEKICGKRKRNEIIEYLLKWVGFSEDENTWEPETNLIGCEKLISEYNATLRQMKKDGIKVNDDDIDNSKKSKPNSSRKKSKLPPYKGPASTKNRTWEETIEFADGPCITYVNEIDNEKPPTNFMYIDEWIFNSSIPLKEKEMFLSTCDCKPGPAGECCNSLGCPCASLNNDGEGSYDSFGRLKIFDRSPIFECNSKCSCNANCSQKVVQNGRRFKIKLSKCSDERGWITLADENIPAGSFIVSYVGEVITNQEACKRFKKYNSMQRTYFFDLDHFSETGMQCAYSIDACEYGNISRFINHSCDPNIIARPVFLDTHDPSLHLVSFFACKDVSAGQELCIDYLGVRGASASIEEDQRKEKELLRLYKRKEKDKKQERLQCLCGSSNCRSFIFF